MTSEKLTLETRDPIPSEPVFVDGSGHRRRRVRAIFYLLGIAGACYTATVGLSMLGVEISAHLPKISTNAVIAQKAATPEPATSEKEETRTGDAEPSSNGARVPQTAPLPAPQAKTPQPAAVTDEVSTTPATEPPTSTPDPTTTGTESAQPEPLLEPSTPQTAPAVSDVTSAPVTPLSAADTQPASDTQPAATPAVATSEAAQNG